MSKSSRTPELLAKYCDSLLKRSSKNEDQQLEVIFVDVMTIFRYVEDKDVFEKFYKKFLANRLVGGKSVSDDAETSMISKLKVRLHTRACERKGLVLVGTLPARCPSPVLTRAHTCLHSPRHTAATNTPPNWNACFAILTRARRSAQSSRIT